jgi:central kinetochore subunit Mal2/MCM21
MTLHRLQGQNRAKAATQDPQENPPSDSDPLTATISAHAAHSTENLYRACASATTFRIQDPDPNAVDGGNILGIRIEVSSAGKYSRPHYIMLNKPWKGTQLLRIHRHTVPPCIPLQALADRYLPAPSVSGDVVKSKKQDLRKFVRALRREIVGYQNRTSTIKSLRKSFKLDEDASSKGKGREKVIADISAADAEAKQVRIEWVDGRIGRAVVDEKGQVQMCVVAGEEGRDWEIERRILGADKKGRMEGIGERLLEGIY